MPQPAPTALVTGGARRIGRAICEDLARHGFAVAVHCHGSRTEADALAATISAQGGQVAVVEADLTDMAQAGQLIEMAARQLGPVDLLVNSASIFQNDSLKDFGWGSWDRHFAIHVKAPALLTRRLAEALPEGREGLVVKIIDQRVWKTTPRYFSYTLSKSALWTATRTMAQALGPRIRVNAIGPGPTLPNERQDQGDIAAQKKSVLSERGPALEEFGMTIRYLWAARSVTGQMIALDGGQHRPWRTPDVTGIPE